MKKINHLFFDLDHTLWDFDRSSSETLNDLYHRYSLADVGIASPELFVSTFIETNYELWDLHNQDKVDKHFIRKKRFEIVFDKFKIDKALLPKALGDDYLKECPTKPYLLDNAKEVLTELAKSYRLHIITNGFLDSQGLKMKSAGIDSFFEVVVTSECTGFKKPSPEIFQYALDLAKATSAESMMIGDNLATDVKGARAVKMESIYYNPQRTAHSETVFAEVSHLSELISLFGNR